MVDQPLSPPQPKLRTKGKLSLPETSPGMNKIAPNNRGIDGKGATTGPDIPADKPEKQTKSDKDDAELLDRLRKRMERAIAHESDNRKAAVDDRKFKAGNQWPADVQAQRNTDKRPCITNNRMPTFVHQVTNPARENRPQINISPIGDKADREGAKVFEGMIRHIERESHADIAYDTALDDAVTSGWGYMRLLTEWRAEKSFDQVLVIRRVRNPFTVYLDPARQEPDGSDCRWGIVTEIIPEDEFENQYPKAQKVPWEVGGQGEKYKSWITKDGIRVAEYYEIEEEPRDLVSLSTGWIGWKDEMGDVLEKMLKDGRAEILDERESFDRKVMYYKCTALEVLERSEWLGKWVPIIPVIGGEVDIEGKVLYYGVIRFAKDAQRMANFWDSLLTELVALAPKAPYIMEEGQLEGHEKEWKNANIKSIPVLTYKGTSLDGHPAPPPQRSGAVPIPEGVIAAKQQSQQDMMATTGIRFDSTLQERMHDESGKALRELNRKTDVGAFHFYDNFRRSLEFLGKQLVDAIPKYYDRKQVITILRQDDKEESVTLDPQLAGPYKESKGAGPDQQLKKYFNPAFGEYAVTVDIGPSYATKRVEAAESMMEFVKALPNTAALVMDLIADEMDWPGADKIAARLTKAIPPQFLTPDLKDIPPQVAAMITNLETQSKQLQQQLQAAMKELGEKQADREVALTKIHSDTEVKLIQIIAKMEETGKKLDVETRKFVADAVMEELRTQRALTHERTMTHEARAHAVEQRAEAAPDDNGRKPVDG
jgi:Phage P22-like portal protein